MVKYSILKVMLLLAVVVAASALSVTNTSPTTTIVVNNVPILPNTSVNLNGPLPLPSLLPTILNISALGRSAAVVVPQQVYITANALFGIASGLLNQVLGVIPVPVWSCFKAGVINWEQSTYSRAYHRCADYEEGGTAHAYQRRQIILSVVGG